MKLPLKIRVGYRTIDIEYAGPDFRLIESSGSNPQCKDYVYHMGDDPNRYTDELIDYDIMNSARNPSEANVLGKSKTVICKNKKKITCNEGVFGCYNESDVGICEK